MCPTQPVNVTAKIVFKINNVDTSKPSKSFYHHWLVGWVTGGQSNLPMNVLQMWITISVTRLGDLLDFGQLFKAFANNYFFQIFPILKQFL